MPGFGWLRAILLFGLAASTGCCAWCDRWCGHRSVALSPSSVTPVYCVPCTPVAGSVATTAGQPLQPAWNQPCVCK